MKLLLFGDEGWVGSVLKERGWIYQHLPLTRLRGWSTRSGEDPEEIEFDSEWDTVILDLRGRGDVASETTLTACFDAHQHGPVVALVDHDDSQTALRCASLGARVVADSFLEKRDEEAASMLASVVLNVVLAQGKEPSKAERRNFELQILQGFAQAVSASLKVSRVCERAVTVLAGWLPDSSVGVYLVRPVSDVSVVRDDQQSQRWALEFNTEAALEFVFPHTLSEEVLDQLTRPGSSDVLKQAQLPKIPSDASVTLVSIPGSNGPIGALGIAQSAAKGRLELEPRVFRSIGAQLGTALENAMLFEELGQAYETLKSTQSQLVHAEKFAAIGLLAAELAHEVNNPAAFVITNLSVMQDYVETVAKFHAKLASRLQTGALEEAAYMRLLREHEIEFLDEDLQALVRRSLVGLERIHQVVMDLRFFSREGEVGRTKVNVESVLEACISLIRHQAKYRAEIEIDFGGVPSVLSDSSRLSQVFLNLLVNAVQAIEAKGEIDGKDWIRVSTRVVGEAVSVKIEDSGTGLSPEARAHAFEPFFTTKDPGSGTGLGLSISRDIVRDLGGELAIADVAGQQGAAFVVTLPLEVDQ